MKRVTVLTSLVCLVLLIIGCVPSLYPYYTKKDLIFDPALVGTWVSEDEKNIYTFAKSDEKVYDLTSITIDSGEKISAEFKACLFKLGDTFYLDTYPKGWEIKNNFMALHLIPIHMITKISIKGDTAEAAMLDSDVIVEMSGMGNITVKHQRVEGGVLLTDSAKKLQKFIKTNSDKIFGDLEKYTRKK